MCKNIVGIILAFFGYVKIPKGIIEGLMIQEDYFKKMNKLFPDNTLCKELLEFTQSLIGFFRSGRYLNRNK